MANSTSMAVKAECISVNERVNNSSVQLNIPNGDNNNNRGNVNISLQDDIAIKADFFRPGSTYEVSFKKVE